MFAASVCNGAPLLISSKTVANVKTLLTETGLYNMTPEELFETLKSCASDGLCSRDEFVLLFSDLSMSNALFQVFDCFDRTDNGTCDLIELSIGLSLLCQGSKSVKLAFAFDLLDDDKDEMLTRRGIWRLIMSFLCALLKVGGYFPVDMDKSDISRVLDNISVATASEILAVGQSQKVTFDAISSWYLSKGCSNSSWIELLDLKKWIPSREPQQLGASTSESSSEDDDDEEEDDEGNDDESEVDQDEDDERTVYIASLVGNDNLVIKASDTARVFAVSRTAGFDEIDSATLVRLLEKYEGPSGCVRPEAFQHFMQNFIALEDLTSETRQGLVITLLEIYQTFEASSDFDEGASLRSLCMGLSLFCIGNKSNKLALGFHVFDVQRNGYLSRRDLELYLFSLLTVLTGMDLVESLDVAFKTARFVALAICKTVGSDRISFATFGEWYNDEGFKIASWIELLNLDKWSKFTLMSENDSEDEENQASVDGDDDDYDGPEEGDEDDEEEDDDDDDVYGGEDDAFTISLHSHGFEKVLDVSKNCVRSVLSFKRTFSRDLTPFQAYVVGLINVSRNGLVHKPDFQNVLQKLGFSLSASLHFSGSFLLRLFDAFDRSSSGYVDTIELITGSTILFDGSKSAKLMFAFELFDSKKQGMLPRGDMWKFLRSFLTTILLLCNLAPSDKLHILIDEAAHWCVEDMMLNCDAEQNSLSFDDLSSYYSSRGYLVCSWLELLDLSKMAALVSE